MSDPTPVSPDAERRTGRGTKRGSSALAVLQRLGRSLMMPIAVLPAAAILLRLGQPDLLGADGLAGFSGMGWMDPVSGAVGTAGEAIFEALPLLFAIGVAIGFARRADGSTALAAVVGYLVFDRVATWTMVTFDGATGDIGSRLVSYPLAVDPVTREPLTGPEAVNAVAPMINHAVKNPTDVLGGIAVGLVAALLWQRYHRIKLPTWLGFFGGRRFVPIVTALAALLMGVVLGLVWPLVGMWIQNLGEAIIGAGALGAGLYGVINRVLLPMGLHHVVNSFIWFVSGTHTAEDGTVTHGEITRYFAGDPDAGGMLSGFFPVLMFGLPGAALAMWLTASRARRAQIGSIMIPAALTAFVTGITEPVEFAFIFVAPVLFAVHIVLTGISMALMNLLDVQLGFGFSAGLIDLLLNATKDNTQGLGILLLFGAFYFLVYFGIFYLLITRFNIPTPGREPDPDETAAPHTAPAAADGTSETGPESPADGDAGRSG
ncbi:PTS sugar transporter subunit IIA [Nocardiopsis terrae]|uniref:PTS system N-acetylglucosamine-specific IIC component n=1 Tax=Nocardiopsis terrae TaxID=372655 RepID=A0ABR9HC70_9ACTN|nr:PTS transporter subunit EIIC [Nocardiopsis terrae]MBE1456617.1 PTS system N-acetylglucosamine-specific IIC component [Nocardiopsis terrae]GHC75931.1 PTS sugar transporter subunit IIA [Nocardiopsis terrae]